MKRRLIKTVKLKFFQDNATGDFGLTHHDTQTNDESFNAFWGAQGIFHDVFEHSHEHSKHFRGIYGMNVGGEMAAMGALWYYFDEMRFDERLGQNRYHSPSAIMERGTLDLVQEAISEGYAQFGSTLESNVPNQKETDNSELEYIIEDFAQKVNETTPKGNGESEIASGLAYKESVTTKKIANLHRWGFRAAQKLIPNNYHNTEVLRDFWQRVEDFCKRHTAEELANYLRGITFKIYRDLEGMISWKAEFVCMAGIPSDEVELITQDLEM